MKRVLVKFQKLPFANLNLKQDSKTLYMNFNQAVSLLPLNRVSSVQRMSLFKLLMTRFYLYEY